MFLLALLGFGSKAGLVPLHVWLPLAHPAAPSHVSALMSGAMIKMGVYGLLRVALDLLGGGPPWWGGAILAAGAVSALLGVLYALMEHDLKRLLAYHSVENIGIIFLGIGAGMMFQSYGLTALALLGLVAGLYHTLNHACFKGLLFLGSGAVLHATHTRNMEELGGLIKGMPRTALCFLVGAVAISGLPPLNGFVSEWLVFQALLGGPQLPRAGAGRAHAVRGGDARADERTGGGLLREGLRHHVSRHAPLGPTPPRRGRFPWPCSSGWARSRSPAWPSGSCPRSSCRSWPRRWAGSAGCPRVSRPRCPG